MKTKTKINNVEVDLSREEVKKILNIQDPDNPPCENPKDDESEVERDHDYPGEKRGPKVKWTEEKIKELKESKRKAAEERRKEREANERFIKQTVDYPISKAEKEKLLDALLTAKEEVQKELVDKQNSLKQASNVILIENTCDHKYEFKYFKEDIFVASCKKCSALKNFTDYEWTIYKRKNK